MVKRAGIILAVIGLLYGLATPALYAAMRQPPETFGAIMSKAPMIGLSDARKQVVDVDCHGYFLTDP